jgi:Fe-S-cluster containining protein
MDKRLQHIVENFDNMKIGVDETFRFHCTECGKCCINREDILLTPKDLYNIAKEFSISTQDVVKAYCETYIGDSSRLPLVRLQPRGSIKRCPLLKDRKCSVHRVKPVVCAMFPIGRCIMVDSDRFASSGIKGCQTEYIFSDPGCGDKSETHTVREWLGKFNISLDDEFFMRWHQTIAEVGSFVHKAEKIYAESSLDKVWSLIYVLLYLNYDTEQEFLPQYIQNAQRLTQMLKLLPVDAAKDHEQTVT